MSRPCALPGCLVAFEPRAEDQLYCSKDCRRVAIRRRAAIANVPPHLVAARALLAQGPCSLAQLAAALGWPEHRLAYSLRSWTRWGHVLRQGDTLTLGPGPCRDAVPPRPALVPRPPRDCKHCGKAFRPRHPDQRYCTIAHREAAHDKAKKERRKAAAGAGQAAAALRASLPSACPQCRAEGALRRQGREVYCAQRCGYYLTPGAAPAPAPELVPDPIELGPALPATPEPPASGEQAQRLAARTGADLWLVLSEALDWGLARLEGPDDP